MAGRRIGKAELDTNEEVRSAAEARLQHARAETRRSHGAIPWKFESELRYQVFITPALHRSASSWVVDGSKILRGNEGRGRTEGARSLGAAARAQDRTASSAAARGIDQLRLIPIHVSFCRVLAGAMSPLRPGKP